MSTAIKYRGGSTVAHSTFTGLAREITVDTTDHTLVVHDGTTVGGYPLALADLSNVTGVAPVESTAVSGVTTPGSCATNGLVFFNTAQQKLYVCNGTNYVEVVSSGSVTYNTGTTTPSSCSEVGALFFNTTENSLYACDGSVYNASVADVPAASGASTPGSCSSVGAIFYNTTEEKLYTCNGSVYGLAVSEGLTAVGASTPGSCSTEGAFFFNSTEEKLYVCTNGAYVLAVPTSAQIEAGSLTVAAFASSIRPVEIFSTLPTTGNSAGRLVFLTTDNKLYRYNGTAFITAIPTSDLTGTISADQLAANSVIAGKIAAGAISATEIAAGAITTEKLYAGAVTADQISANAITSSKIVANAIVAGKIAAGVVTATELSANAVTADKITAGAITTAKLAAGAVTATELAAGAVVADKISSGAVTAVKIAAGAVTADKISSGTATIATGLTFQLGTSSTIGGYTGAGAFTSSNAGNYGVISANSAGGFGLGAGTTATTGLECGVVAVGAGNNSSFSSYKHAAWLGTGFAGGVFQTGGASDLSAATAADIRLAYHSGGVSYSYYVVAGTAHPFTAGHDGLQLLTEPTPTIGDIMVDVEVVAAPSVDNTITEMTVSTSSNQKGAVGVFTGTNDVDFVPASLGYYTTGALGAKNKFVLKPEFQDVYNTYRAIAVNAIGEGKINVCGQNGDIQVGDLICVSDMAGKGMKQTSEFVMSYTVAKARENVVFDTPTTVKQIACIYMCG